MGLIYRNLDERTRQLMVKEIDRDIEAGSLYISDNLNQEGRLRYPSLLLDAAKEGTDSGLATKILGLLNPREKPRRLKSGGLSAPPKMRSNAHEMLAEGEFNRFYIRALCLRGIEDGIQELTVYRAKSVESPRPDSESKIGQRLPVRQLLDDLRTRAGVDTALGLPPGPNSGLSAYLP